MDKSTMAWRAREGIILVLQKYSPRYLSARGIGEELNNELRFISSAMVAQVLSAWLRKPDALMKGYVLEFRYPEKDSNVKTYRLVPVNYQDSSKSKKCLEETLKGYSS